MKRLLGHLAGRRRPALVETVHAVISAVFNEAVDEDLINADPATGILKSIFPAKNQRDVKPPDPYPSWTGIRFGHPQTADSYASVLMITGRFSGKVYLAVGSTDMR